MSLTSNPIVILGMQRSGTSGVAQALSELGVFFGNEAEFYATDANNEAGYFEIDEIIRTNKDLLYAFHRPWNLVKPFPDNWKELPQANESVGRLTALLAKHFAGKSRWGFKEPTSSLLLPPYKQVFCNLGLTPTYVICVRNPLDVLISVNRHAESYAEKLYETHEVKPKVAGQTFLSAPLGNLAFGMWLHFTLSSLRETAGENTSVVLYEQFVENPGPFLRHIASSVDSWTPSDEQWSAAVSTVRPKLRHNAKPIEELEAYPSLLRRTYELCRSISGDPAGLRAGDYASEIEALWQELILSRDMLREPDPLLGNLVISWRGDSGVKAIEKVYVPQPTWQTLSATFDAPPGGMIIGAFFQQPCVAWIRSALWHVGGQTFPVALEPGPSCELTQVDGTLHRLFANAEVFQFRAITPNVLGPYELEFELWLEIDPQVVIDGIGILVANLSACRERMNAADAHIRQLQEQIRALTFSSKGPSGPR